MVCHKQVAVVLRTCPAVHLRQHIDIKRQNQSKISISLEDYPILTEFHTNKAKASWKLRIFPSAFQHTDDRIMVLY
ncbi:hypothetical protein ACOSQ3_001941 [Xanthoceras sorbifolium]